MCVNQSRGGAGLLDNGTCPRARSFHYILRTPRSEALLLCRHLKLRQNPNRVCWPLSRQTSPSSTHRTVHTRHLSQPRRPVQSFRSLPLPSIQSHSSIPAVPAVAETSHLTRTIAAAPELLSSSPVSGPLQSLLFARSF